MEQEYSFLANALNNLDGAVWIVDTNISKTLFVNTKFRELISISADSDCQEISVIDCVTRLGTVFESMNQNGSDINSEIQRLRDTPSFEIIIPTQDGRHMRLNRYPDSNGCAVINFTDVTDLVVASEKAKQAEIAKTAFLANMSHEIRTPMNGVVGMTQVLAGTELDERQRTYVDLIARSGKSLVSIINDILDFSKIESGKFSIHTEPFNFTETIHDIVSLMGYTARGKNIELILDMPENPSHELIGDSGRLRQVLINLIGNGIKFTSEGYVKLGVHIGREGNNARAKFSVTDTGIGIPDDKIETIFKQFAQAESATAQNFGGTGLGLTISQQLVQLMDGDISVTSKIGKGSEFSFTLDFPMTGVSSAIESPSDNLGANGAPILVIDDMPMNHIVLSNQLTALGAKPLCVSSAEMALEVMKKAAAEGLRFPLVISDFQMPGMNGLEFVTTLRATPSISDTSVMILSSVNPNLHMEAFAKLGVTHIHEKPCLSVDLSRAVTDALSQNKASKTLGCTAAKNLLRINSNIKVLAADHSALNRNILSKLLSHPNVSLILVEDGSQALEKFTQDVFDIVLLDIAMPEFDGMSTASAMRRLECQNTTIPTPIIALTANGVNDDPKKYAASGMNGFLTSPIDKALLFETIDKWSSAKKSASEIMSSRYAKAS